MKKLLYIVSILLLFTACAASPEKVAEKVTKALAEGDMETAKANSTEAAGELYSFMERMLSPEEYEEKFANQTFEYVRTEEDGDNAKVYYMNGDVEEHMDLVKEDGKWLVNISLDK